MCMFCRSLFVLFLIGRCVVCSSIYGFWLPLLYIQTLIILLCDFEWYGLIIIWQNFNVRLFCCKSDLQRTIRVSLVKQELLTLPEHLSSPPVFSGVRVTRSLVLCVCFVDRYLSLCTFSSGHCAVCNSSIYILITPLVSSNSSNIILRSYRCHCFSVGL